MKVTVKDKYLNVRSGSPSVNAPCYQYIAPGSEIEVDGQLYEGDLYSGVNTWMKDLSGNYYWSGGVTNIDGSKSNTNYSWSISLLGVDQVWGTTKGENIKVAIIDSGIDLSNSDLSAAVLSKYNVMDNSNKVQDTYFHGTYCSTMACSRGGKGIFGTAPACNVIVIKIMNDATDLTFNNEILGISKALELGADIISISFGSTIEEPTMSSLLSKCMAQGIICIAAAGDNKNDVVNFPANQKGMISVGNIGCSNPQVLYGQGTFFLSQCSPGVIDTTINEGVTIVAPGDGISAYDLNGNQITPFPGTSYSAPHVAGIAALWLSVIKRKNISTVNNHKQFRDFIISNAIKSQTTYDPATWGNGVINPLPILSL